MKILYSLPATGNGHISRAISLNPWLSKFGEVDYLISGMNSSLFFPYKITYRLKGISLFYNKNGGLDHLKFIRNINLIENYRSLLSLPVEKYDWVITDFEPLTSLACKIKNVSCMQWGHQASFSYRETPRPEKSNFMGECVLKKYASGNINLGLHFQSYHPNITGPVIKKSIREFDGLTKDLITVYLPQYGLHRLLHIFKKFKNTKIHIFHPSAQDSEHHDNISLFPINMEKFSDSLKYCKLIITGAGFETPAEALYLSKRLLCIPIKSHYEQLCNSVALNKMGVTVLNDIDEMQIELIQNEFEQYRTDVKMLDTPSTEEISRQALYKWESVSAQKYFSTKQASLF